MNEILYADHLLLKSESIENWREKVSKWKKTFESKRLKVNLKVEKNLKTTKVKVSGAKGKVGKSIVDPRAKWSAQLCLRAKNAQNWSEK